MKVFISMSVAVLFYSLYPIFATMQEKEPDPYITTLVIQSVAFLSAGFFVLLYLTRKKKLQACIELHKQLDPNVWLNILIAGACSAFLNLFFILALAMANKGGVSVIVEGWPILAVFMTPFMVNKVWDPIDKKDIFFGLIALIGVGLIVFSDKSLYPTDEEGAQTLFGLDSTTFLGYVFALLASYLTAVHSLTKANYSLALKDIKNSTTEVLLGEMLSRGLGTFIMIIVVFALGKQGNWSEEAITTGFLIGFFVILLAGASYTYAIMKARSPNVHIFYYMIPVLAVLWLYLAGLTEISTLLVFGGLLVVFSNIIIFFKNRKRARTQAAE